MLSVYLSRVAAAIYAAAGTNKVRDECLRMLHTGDVMGLVSQKISPHDYTDALVFKRDYQCVNLLRKLKVDIAGVNPSKVAIDNFWVAEKQCFDTNRRFERLLEGGTISPMESRALSVLDGAREFLRTVLGSIPATIEGRFGPGSSAECRGPASTIPDKLRSISYITKEAWDLLPLVYRTRLLGPLGRQKVPGVASGNVFTTVPKDALKDRGICMEPGLNLWFQLGIGGHIRRRLRLAGVDIETAQTKHRQWAQQASRDGLKATIDLTNASDTLARYLLKWLLPPDWFLLLDCLRSPCTLVPSPHKGNEKALQRVRLEKFSSMGNGFTFELETLVFASLCHAVKCGSFGVDFSVYGDDLIVPTERASDVLAVLKFCGFTPNPRKTFVSGWFRESCGGDYFKGVDVSSHYQKVDPAEPQEWISMANGIRRTARFRGVGFCYTHQHKAWLACLSALPSDIRRLRGPVSLGDLVIHDCDYTICYKMGYGRVRVLKPKPIRVHLSHWDSDTVMTYLVYSSSPGTSSERRQLPRWPFDEVVQRSLGVIPRDSIAGYKLGYVAYG